MTERPILFSGDMVRAILAGRKTQTRRIIKPQPELVANSGRWAWPLPKKARRQGCYTTVYSASREWYEYAPEEAWAYSVGDRLWVRESLEHYHEPEVHYWELRYAADHYTQVDADLPEGWMPAYRWHKTIDGEIQFIPSIHMPKWAARIWLEVTGVRVERLQEIAIQDLQAEGMQFGSGAVTQGFVQFKILWDSLNAKRGFPWASNPWVWVIEFRRLADDRPKRDTAKPD